MLNALLRNGMDEKYNKIRLYIAKGVFPLQRKFLFSIKGSS